MAVFRSDKHIFAQMIDDEKKQTLVSFSDLNLEKKELKGLTKTQKAALVGQKLAKNANEQGIKKAVFDRGGFLYHGRVAALAKNAREAGLIF
ncbi:MAG: 50S ribosomal protein L18 [candidate division CPR1 bacterium GW2011_GWA2_42_17]|uniref:Large ribosomal subunit protein uL18 n=1 Tax=candidate division CPR1 bacterium GW2011_GWA2_42_17 TaxID=1618341 RepID=A0A0G1C2M7_9BACT|nr:MAG: 50S ribosomal protein L18 [candidate division CPR1 bacterium GW2011_GWA2_42_17]